MKILDNNVAILEGDTHISKWVVEARRLDHDYSTLEILLPFINSGDYVVDAGAFIGDHTIAYLKAVGSEGKVFAFEPNPDAYQCLCHNCPAAVTFNSGLSDRPSVAGYKHDENAGASHITRDTVRDRAVQLITLDFLRLRRCNFIKLDVEGCEYEALVGAAETITRHKPVMWIEVNEGALNRRGETPEELTSLLRDFGYDIRPYPESLGPQYDILCTPLRTS